MNTSASVYLNPHIGVPPGGVKMRGYQNSCNNAAMFHGDLVDLRL